jgi:nicotinamide-nucleotide amidase
MVSVSSLCVGKELLVGKTVNTNAHWIGARLLARGSMLDRILTVTDSLDEISWGLTGLVARGTDFVIVVGGLGPTPDDMTLKGIALAVGKKMRLNRDALRMIKEHYARTGRAEMEITPARRKMAVMPEGATPLTNEEGTAPGVRIENGGAIIFCLPGVPREMKSIYKSAVEPEISRKIGKLYTTKVVMQVEGVGESTLAPEIARAVRAHPSAYIKSHPKGTKEGKTRIELDVVAISPRKEKSESESREIAGFFVEKIAQSEGKILRQTVYRS